MNKTRVEEVSIIREKINIYPKVKINVAQFDLKYHLFYFGMLLSSSSSIKTKNLILKDT